MHFNIIQAAVIGRKKKEQCGCFHRTGNSAFQRLLERIFDLSSLCCLFLGELPFHITKKKLPLMNMNDLFSKTLLYEATFSIKSSIQYYYSTHHNVLLMKSPEVCSRNHTSSNIIAQVLLYFNWQGGCVCSHIGKTNNRVSAGLQKVFKKLDLVALKKKTSFITKSCF